MVIFATIAVSCAAERVKRLEEERSRASSASEADAPTSEKEEVISW